MMWPRKKGTPQTVTGTDKEWSQTGTLVHKPARGWLHSDETIVDGGGVCYCVQYVGLTQIIKSMRSLKFEDRTQVTREAMMRCVEESGMRTIKKRKVPKHISKMIGGRPVVGRAGTNVNLKISIEGLRLTAVDSGELIADHGMPSISFATGGEGEGIDFIGYVAKDQVNDRACHCFDCGDLAYDIITTIGQAFELRYKTYLTTKAVPLEIHGFGEGRDSGMGFDEDSGQTLPHSNVPPPPRRTLPNPPGSAAAKDDRCGAQYDTLNDKARRKSSDNFYDERAPNGGTASGAACAAVCASNDFMSPGKPREEIGYSSVREEGPPAGDRNSSYDNPNVFNDAEAGAAMYDNAEGRDRGGNRANLFDQNGHTPAGKRPSATMSFDDSIYDNNGSDSIGRGQHRSNGHHMSAASDLHQSGVRNGDVAPHSNVPLPAPPVHQASHPPPVHQASHPPPIYQASHPPPMTHMASPLNAPLPQVPTGNGAAARGVQNMHSSGVRGGIPPGPTPVTGIDVDHDLMAHDWFHGILSRDEAENILEEDGEFLVRESSTQPGQYVLSGMENRRVKHLLLVDPEGVVRTRDRIFVSVPELIHFHIEHSLPIVSAGSSLSLGTAVVIDMTQE